MHDPFPLPASTALSSLVTKFSNAIALPALPLHIHEILLAAAAYHVICFGISPVLSRAVFPKTYQSLKPKTRLNWDVHVVSLVQSTMIIVVGFWVLLYDEQRVAMDWRERVYGYDGALGMVVALAAGYFLWDLWLSVRYVTLFGPGLLAHAVSALTVYLFGFRPLVNYYAPVFILFELSSPFLNFHWFFDKLNMTGSDPQLYNGILLMSTFFGSRLVWGAYNCFRVFPDMIRALSYQKTPEGIAWLAEQRARATIDAATLSALEGDLKEVRLAQMTAARPLPTWIAAVYMASYLTLMILNVYWFAKMVETIRARFDPPWGTRKAKEEASEPAKGEISGARRILNNGSTLVELEETEVRQRRSRSKA